MNNIINLTKGYIETIITIKKQVILISLFALMLGIFEEGFILYGAGVAVIILVNQVLSLEDISGIDFLVSSLPVSRKEYVLSRYVGGLIAVIAGAVLVSGSYCIVQIVGKSEISLPYLYFLITSIISSIIIVAVNIPVFLKYGTLNGRLILTLVNVAGIFLPIVIIGNLNSSKVFIEIISNPVNLALCLMLLGGVTVYMSIFISLKLVGNKEVKK